MKSLSILVIIMVMINLSCMKETSLSEKDKKIVETEIHQFLDSLQIAYESVIPEKVFSFFLQTDEFVAASQGNLYTDRNAILDTMKVHLAIQKSQSIKTVAERLFIINREAAVYSTSKVSTITFINDSQFTMPYCQTMLLVKREGKWKIAHYHAP
jgi:hypothetical protein